MGLQRRPEQIQSLDDCSKLQCKAHTSCEMSAPADIRCQSQTEGVATQMLLRESKQAPKGHHTHRGKMARGTRAAQPQEGPQPDLIDPRVKSR